MDKVLILAVLVYFALPSVASPLCVFIDRSGEVPQVIAVPDFFCNEVGQFDLAGCGNDPVCRKQARDDRRNLFCDEYPDHPRCNKNNGTQESPTSCKDGEHRDENGQCVPSNPCDPSSTGSGFRAQGALGGSDAECPSGPSNDPPNPTSPPPGRHDTENDDTADSNLPPWLQPTWSTCVASGLSLPAELLVGGDATTFAQAATGSAVTTGVLAQPVPPFGSPFALRAGIRVGAALGRVTGFTRGAGIAGGYAGGTMGVLALKGAVAATGFLGGYMVGTGIYCAALR
jgi:hypothetical protein